MRIKDHYKTLGVKRTVDQSGVRAAFRRLAKQYHPDIGGPQKTRCFQEIVEAYSVLSDPESRVCYNRVLLKSEGWADAGVKTRRVEPPDDIARPRPQRQTSRAEEIFDLLFENLTGWGHERGRFQRERSLDVEVILSKKEAGQGGILPLPCPVLVKCRSCGGPGLIGRSICACCNGRGIVEEKETVRIKIPAGVRDESTLEVSTGDFGNPGIFLRLLIRVSNF